MFIRNARTFDELLDILNIQTIDDIPTRDQITEAVTAGNHTARDIWFGKMYKNGVNLSFAEAVRLKKYPLSKEKEAILYHMERNFPPVSKSKESVTGIVSTIKQHMRNIPDYYTRKYIDIKPELKKIGQGTDSRTLNNIEKDVLDVGLPLQKEKQTNIFNYIEDMQDYDNIMRKIMSGIAGIPDVTVRRNILINLLGTRFDQNLDMQASQFLAKMGDPERAWYNPKTGIVVGERVRSGKKQLPPKVPLGPFMRDMMDQQWSAVTENGKFATDVGMWDVIPQGTKGGDIVNKYLFKITRDNPQGIFTNEEIELLGRIPKGFTDLRRLTLAYNARKTGNEGIADQLLGHGVDEKGKAITAPADGIEMVSAVGRGYYLPGKPTPIENLRAFNIALEQNVAKLLGHENYVSLNNEWNVIGTDEKSGVTGKFINEIETFAQDDIVNPDSVNETIKLENLSQNKVVFKSDPEIIKTNQELQIAQGKEATSTANLNIMQNAMNFMADYNKNNPTEIINLKQAAEMLENRGKLPDPPVQLKGKAKEIGDRIDSITDKDGNVDKSRLHNQQPATQDDINKAIQQTGANTSTRAGRNTVKNFLKGLGKYLPFVSFGVGLKIAKDIRSGPAEAFASFGDIDEGPKAGQKDFTAQMLGAFGVDQPEELQELRAKYETIYGALPANLSVLPPGNVLLPTDEEREQQKQKEKELQNRLSEDDIIPY